MAHAHSAKFGIGMIIRHRLFEYRGVIADVDAVFGLNDEWYQRTAKSKPPKNAPWYHILVDGDRRFTYVAERNLELDDSLMPVQHPEINKYFAGLDDGRYRPREARM